jgi:hypothetical protein
VGADPDIVVLGLGEAWLCGSPEQVRQALGWRSRSSERNGVAMVARHGFAGPEQWVQLDTSRNPNPADTKWVLRQDVCLDAACSAAVPVFVAHWYAHGTDRNAILDRQADQTVEFLRRTAGQSPHVFVGDLNVCEGTRAICSDDPNNTSLQPLRAAGYVDAWPLLHGAAEGNTGMLNRKGCGVPQGSAWKRIAYVWSPPSLLPRAMTRFGVVAAGTEAPSDHYGIIAAFPRAGGHTPMPPGDPRGCATPDPFVALGGGTCVNGGWRPPGMAEFSSAAATANPASQEIRPERCDAPHAFAAQGGSLWICGDEGGPHGIAAVGVLSEMLPGGTWAFVSDDGALYELTEEPPAGFQIEGLRVAIAALLVADPEKAWPLVEVLVLSALTSR